MAWRAVLLFTFLHQGCCRDCSLASLDGNSRELVREGVSIETGPRGVNCDGVLPFYFDGDGSAPPVDSGQRRVVVSGLKEMVGRSATISFFVQGKNLQSGDLLLAPVFGYGTYTNNTHDRCGLFLWLSQDRVLIEATPPKTPIVLSANATVSNIALEPSGDYTHFAIVLDGAKNIISVFRDCVTDPIISLNVSSLDGFRFGIPDCTSPGDIISTLGDFNALQVKDQKAQFSGRIDRVRLFSADHNLPELGLNCLPPPLLSRQVVITLATVGSVVVCSGIIWIVVWMRRRRSSRELLLTEQLIEQNVGRRP